MSRELRPLRGEQRNAVDPRETVWLAASAGTGKTHVLTSRVLRLLLQRGIDPSQILCLTFTKAGAAEMAVRVNETLAEWVRLPDTVLARHLDAIGAEFGPETVGYARTLFARVLDCPGGGLRIDTIHAFAQWLLSAFPEEAGLNPGTRAMEDRDRDLLFRNVLAQFLADAEQRGDDVTLAALADLSLKKGPDAAEAWLMRCGSAHELWFGRGAWQAPLQERVNALLGLAADAGEGDAAALCADAMFDAEALRCCLSAYGQWNGKKGQEGRIVIADWLAAPAAQRLALLPGLHAVLFTQKDTVRDVPSLEKFESAFGEAAARVLACAVRVREFRILLDLAAWLAPMLELGRKFALAWDAAKTREGFVDFDDQIRRASELLSRSDLGEWIRYKLDRHFDHILVDEAQDTNEAQWRIILDGLTSEFFSGLGQHDDKLRTLFVVGDYKQAIFRFQGTSPKNFRSAQERVHRAMEDARFNAIESRSRQPGRLRELGLDRSFRTAQPVLDFIDAAIDAIGYERFGLAKHPGRHSGDERPGLVTLWPPVAAELEGDDGDGDGDGDRESAEEGGQTWLPRSDRILADKIALQIQAWLSEGYPLAKGGHRNATAGDIMVLVRQRKELAALIVARLHARGVAVAGVDRLRLGGPLAVKDLMAALRFAAQPLDDLSLANLLVSPLVGWSQEELLRHGWRAPKLRLWDHLRRSADMQVRATLERLGELLRLADYEPPQVLLHWMLVGPWRGRKALVARLGREANDPIDELLNAALAFSSAHTPSLQGFIQWFDVGEGELKRDAGSGADQVRVMTVHGSKGLEAPIVILADAAGNPDSSRGALLELTEMLPGGGEGRKVPLPSLAREQRVGRIAEAEAAAAAAEREEHWRLLYVAMTRAEEALFIGGSLRPREDEPAPESWFAQLRPLFGEDAMVDPLWGERWEIGQAAAPVTGTFQTEPRMQTELPQWAVTPIGPEPRPPRPLAPSSAGEDLGAAPPLPSEALKAAARRGTLVHALLERLPELPPEARESAAARWLARRAADLPEDARAEIAASAIRVLDTPDWVELFGPDALAEVPLAATVGGRVIAGTADRLLVTKERVLLVDFKTAARPPQNLDAVPLATVRQMAAYVAALEAIYPEKRVEAAVLYTHAPQLFALPADLIEAHKQALSPAE